MSAIAINGGAGWRYENGSQESAYIFNAAGQQLSHTQRNGYVTTYSYNAAGQLTAITNHFGRSVSFGYNAFNLINQINTPDNQTIRYEYDANQRLTFARYSDNTAKQYLYENITLTHLLTGVIDENSQRLSTYSYDDLGRAIETTKSGGVDRYQVEYRNEPGQILAAVRDPLQTMRNYNYSTNLSQLAVTGANIPSATGQRDASSRIQNSLGFIEQETDFNGFVTAYQWDTSRRLQVSETRAAGTPDQQTKQTIWHPTLRLPSQIIEQGKSTAFTYDSVGNVLSKTEIDTTGNASNGQARTWSYAYNSLHQQTSMTDPRGGAWSFAYDAQGNRNRIINPLGHVTSYTHDGAGRVLTETASNGLVTSYTYDNRGRLLHITRGSNLPTAQQQKTSYTYRPSGQVASVLQPNGHLLSYQHDAAQRIIGITDNRGNQTSYSLDAMGNAVAEQTKDSNNQIALAINLEINSLNRLAAVRDSQNQTVLQFGYDSNGEQNCQSNANNDYTCTVRDALRRPIAIQLPDGQVDNYYNQLNQLTRVIDPKGVETSYVRNAWGEVLSETSPDIGVQTFTRDATGNALSMTDAKGQTTNYQFDALSRVTNITFADGKQQQFFYDGNSAGAQIGSLREMTDASGGTRYERDPFARITKKIQTVNDNPAAPTVLTTSYAYTHAGELAQITYPSGMNVFYRRNASGQITSIDTQKPRTSVVRVPAITPLVINLQYTALNQPKAWNWNCATGNLYTPTIQQNCDSATRAFDADGRMTSTEFSTLSYDPDSRIIGITQQLWASRTVTQTVGTQTATITELYQTPLTWQASYDSRGRLTSFNRAGSEQSYTYDPNSNRLTSIAKKVSDTDIDGIFEATDRAATTSQLLNIEQTSNKLLGFNQSVLTQATAANGTRRTISNVITAVNYQLDQNGNLTSDGLRTFDYNAENRLGQVQITQNGEAAKITYLHNAAGQRVFKSEPLTAQTLPNETQLGTTFVDWLKKNFQWLYATAQTNATLGTSYSYGEAGIPSWAMTGEYGNGGATSTGRTEYIWLPQDDGSAIPVAMFRGNRYFNIHSDHLGTPRLITDDTAKPTWQWSYSAFGDNKPTGILKATTNPNTAITSAPLLNATSPATVLNLRFPGQYADSETGLFYNYFRTYDPKIRGGYIQPDPIGLDGGWNRFGYVEGNPLSFTDPEGLNPYGQSGSSRFRCTNSNCRAPHAGVFGGLCYQCYQRENPVQPILPPAPAPAPKCPP